MSLNTSCPCQPVPDVIISSGLGIGKSLSLTAGVSSSSVAPRYWLLSLCALLITMMRPLLVHFWSIRSSSPFVHAEVGWGD